MFARGRLQVCLVQLSLEKFGIDLAGTHNEHISRRFGSDPVSPELISQLRDVYGQGGTHTLSWSWAPDVVHKPIE